MLKITLKPLEIVSEQGKNGERNFTWQPCICIGRSRILQGGFQDKINSTTGDLFIAPGGARPTSSYGSTRAENGATGACFAAAEMLRAMANVAQTSIKCVAAMMAYRNPRVRCETRTPALSPLFANAVARSISSFRRAALVRDTRFSITNVHSNIAIGIRHTSEVKRQQHINRFEEPHGPPIGR